MYLFNLEKKFEITLNRCNDINIFFSFEKFMLSEISKLKIKKFILKVFEYKFDHEKIENFVIDEYKFFFGENVFFIKNNYDKKLFNDKNYYIFIDKIFPSKEIWDNYINKIICDCDIDNNYINNNNITTFFEEYLKKIIDDDNNYVDDDDDNNKLLINIIYNLLYIFIYLIHYHLYYEFIKYYINILGDCESIYSSLNIKSSKLLNWNNIKEFLKKEDFIINYGGKFFIEAIENEINNNKHFFNFIIDEKNNIIKSSVIENNFDYGIFLHKNVKKGVENIFSNNFNSEKYTKEYYIITKLKNSSNNFLKNVYLNDDNILSNTTTTTTTQNEILNSNNNNNTNKNNFSNIYRSIFVDLPNCKCLICEYNISKYKKNYIKKHFGKKALYNCPLNLINEDDIINKLEDKKEIANNKIISLKNDIDLIIIKKNEKECKEKILKENDIFNDDNNNINNNNNNNNNKKRSLDNYDKINTKKRKIVDFMSENLSPSSSSIFSSVLVSKFTSGNNNENNNENIFESEKEYYNNDKNYQNNKKLEILKKNIENNKIFLENNIDNSLVVDEIWNELKIYHFYIPTTKYKESTSLNIGPISLLSILKKIDSHQ